MLRFTIRRLLELVPVLLAVVTITFFLIRLAPGGPFTNEREYPEEAIQRMNEFYGLDKPLPAQYLNYLSKAVRGNLGPSIHNPTRTVNDIIAENFPVSLELGVYAMIFALLFGLTAGLTAALRHNTWWDHTVMPVAMTGICVPSFVIGPILALVCGLQLGWFNVAGWEHPSDRVLPAITLGLGVAAYIARLSRGSMLEVLPQDYIRTARAKGLSEGRVLLRHALKNALIPVVSFLGPAAAGIITGSFVVETIFQIPGLGRMFVMSAFNRDYPLILGLVAFYALIVVLFNLLVDLSIAWLNPRTRTRAAT
jgi:oligopeptide transport system permease protein